MTQYSPPVAGCKNDQRVCRGEGALQACNNGWGCGQALRWAAHATCAVAQAQAWTTGGRQQVGWVLACLLW